MRLSHTQLSMLLRCPKQYEFRYIYGLRRPGSHFLLMGSSYHAALEHNFRTKIASGRDAPMDEVLDAFAEDFETRREAEEYEFKDATPGEAKDTGIRATRLYREARAPFLSPILVEDEFEISVGSGLTLSGKRDLITETEIIDHKLTRKAWTTGKEHADLQPSAYLLSAMEEGLPQRSFVFHVNVTRSSPIVEDRRTTRSEEELKAYRHLLMDAARLIEGGIFLPCDPTNWLCGPEWCGYYDICRGKKGPANRSI